MVHASARQSSALAPEREVFRPPRTLGVIVGAAFVLWTGAGAVVVASLALAGAADFTTFLAWVVAGVLGVLCAAFAAWLYSLVTLSYVIDEDDLTIRWGFRSVVIPIQNIQRMVPGRTLDEPHIRGLNWWGCHIGEADVKRLGYTLFFSTHNTPDELLYVVTAQESYALTIEDQPAFAEEIQARSSIGAAPLPGGQRSVASGVAALTFWRDRAATAALGISALLCLAMAGYLLSRYQSLPDVIRLEFPDLDGVVRVGNRSELLEMIWVGLGILAVNTVLGIIIHSRERAAGLWLLASTGMLQIVLLIAAAAAIQNA